MLFTNIVHRLDAKPSSREALGFQWAEARRLGLPTTTLLTYPALFDADALADEERLVAPGDELGLHLHEIKRRHPSVRTAITSCFEEGVKMYYGNNRNWLLFSDGGPWNPYFPAQANALAPACDAGETIDIVAIPHLNRDMSMALSSRDDWFASHPGNVFRARINEGAECPYLFRFFAAWERQAALNGWSYMNVFVSSPWMLGGHWCVEREEDVRALYTETLEYLKAREEAGAVRNVTMDAFGQAFRSRVAPDAPTICQWRDELGQSKREVIWLSNSHHRSCFDMARGGALVDFRPYDGRLNLDLGPRPQQPSLLTPRSSRPRSVCSLIFHSPNPPLYAWKPAP